MNCRLASLVVSAFISGVLLANTDLTLAQEKKEEPKKTEPAAPPAVNPLQNLFRRLLPQAPQPAPPQAVPQNGQKPVDPDARDHVDARAPKDRKQQEILRKATAAIDNKEWTQAIDLLHNLLGQPEDSVERKGNEPWGSVRERAMRLMLQLPDEVVRTYRQRWNVEAQRRLEEAERSGRADSIAQVASRFLLTDAGQAAADRLGTRHLDRGEFSLAKRWFQWLLEAKAAITSERAWQLKAALAARQMGDSQLADKLRNARPAESSTPSDSEQVELGGAKVRVGDWWSSPLPPPTLAPLNDWPMFLGKPSRSGVAAAGEPLLLPRWREPLTQLQPLQRQIEMLVEDSHDQNRPTLTVVHPLVLEGLVILRTLSGVQVYDLETGRLRWSTAEHWPAESLIGPGNNAYAYQNAYTVQMPQVLANGNVGNVRVVRRFGVGVSYDYSGMPIDNHPLGYLLFLNGNFGQVSSDGRQLFVVEDDTFVGHGGGYYGGGLDMSRMDPLRRSWSSNKLVSYDLPSGRPNWTVGGVESEEAFQPELPGVFSFGAPVPDGDDLFIVGERDGEIRLYCLHSQTGQPLWSQLIAAAETDISKDLNRRCFTAQVAVSDGLVICPTTVGWLTAVDRASHQLQWVYRYSTPQPNNQRRMPTQALTPFMQGNMRWGPSAPVIVGDSVVYTPQEMQEDQTGRSANLVCLNLNTGARRWFKPKDNNWHALNAVADGKVLLIGPQALTALSLADGNQVWSKSVESGDGLPSGLGVVSGDRWHVPLSSGQIWTLSLKNGELLSRQWSAPGTLLGNLALHRDSVVSVHASGLTCFEQRDSVLERIRQSKERDPLDATALLTEASILQLERKSAEAWNVLKQVRDDSVPAELRSRFRSTARDVLTAVIEPQPRDHTAELQTLERLLDSPDDRLLWQRLQVEHLRGRGEHAAALELLLAMAREDLSRKLTLQGPPSRLVRLDAWLAGQFAALWNSTPADARAELDRKFAAEVQRLADTSAESRRATLTLFGFHPAARELRWQDIEERIAQRDLAPAELALIRLTESANARDAARAWQRLIELYRTLGLPDDAAVAAQSLKRLGEIELGGGITAAQWVAKEAADGKLAESVTSHQPDWSELAFKLERSAGFNNYNEPIQDCPISDARWPFFNNQRFQYQQVQNPMTTQRLILSRLPDNQLDWSLPLRQKQTSNYGFGVAVRTVGHQMLVFHREVLHLLSPVDHRVVWTRSLESRGQVMFDPNQMSRRLPQPFVNGNDFPNRPVDPMDEAARNSLLTMCTPEFIAYRGRRLLTVVDAATGEWRWELRDIPTDTRIVASNDFVFLSSQRAWPNGLLLRASDGQQLPLDDVLRDKFQKSKLTRGSDLVLVSRTPENGKDVIAVERWDTLKRQTVWRQTFATNEQFTWLDQQALASLSPDFSLNTLDLESGERRKLATLKAADLAGRNDQRFLIADSDRVFLIVSGQRQNYYGDEFVSIPVNGTVFAFDRRAGGELWRQNVSNQGLVVQQFAASPVLFFSTRRYEQRSRVSTQLSSLLLLDKRTGRKLFDDTFPNQFSGYRGLNLNLADRQLEILTYNDRIRLTGSQPEKP